LGFHEKLALSFIKYQSEDNEYRFNEKRANENRAMKNGSMSL